VNLNKLPYFILILVFGLIGYSLYLSNFNFKVIKDKNGNAIQINVKTGESWILLKNKKILQKEPPKPLKQIELSKDALTKITGQATIDNGIKWLNCEIYNGSDFQLKKVFVQIKTTLNGKTNIDRIYELIPKLSSLGRPLTSTPFHGSLGYK